MNQRMTIGWLGLAGMLGALAWLQPAAAMAAKDHFEVGDSVPVFSLKTINPDISGENFVSIDNYYGPQAKTPKKAIILSFFASYCKPCKHEMPFLAALYDQYKDKGLQVLLVSIDKSPDKIDQARDLAKKNGVKFPVLSDRFNIVAKRYMIQKLPNLYVLNSEGKVSLVKVGYTGSASKELLAEVRKNLGEPATDPIPPALAKYMDEHAETASAAVAESGTQNAAAADTGHSETATRKERANRRRRHRWRRRHHRK